MRLSDPKKQGAQVTPHHIQVIVTIELKEQSPVGSAWLEFRGAWILVARPVATVEAVADQLRFQFHVVTLYRRRKATDLVLGTSAERAIRDLQ